MIHFRTDSEIELLRQAALLVGKTLGEVGKHIRPGVRTIELDRIAEESLSGTMVQLLLSRAIRDIPEVYASPSTTKLYMVFLATMS